jgi:V/A-type H+-transporting ATPase subunit C
LSNKHSDSEYICLSAILRAKEAKLLSRARLEQMLAEPTFADACRLAETAGYENMIGMTVQQVNAALAAHRAREFEELQALIPDERVMDFYRMRYSYHNAKVLVKSGGDAQANAALFSDAARYGVDELLEAYAAEEQDPGALSPAFAQAIREAKQVLARTNNPQLADFVLDRAYFAETLDEAERIGKPFLQEFIRNRIDRANLGSALRTLDRGNRDALLRAALIEGGHVGPEEILRAAESREEIIKLFSATIFLDAAAAPDMTGFEKAAENALHDFLCDGNYITYGPEVVVEYLAALENEILSLRIILTGKLMGIGADTLRERLRESYV